MKRIFIISIVSLLLLSKVSFAQENYLNDLVVLNENTFVKIHNSSDNLRIIQLFKIENDQIHLVDAIQIDEKKVNFLPLYQYKRLKIEQKD